MFVQIALNIPSPKIFTYRVPAAWQEEISIGRRVLVPFGKTKKTGVIISISEGTTCSSAVKDILDLIDTEPLFGEEELNFYCWATQYYMYPLGKALGEILPGGEKKSYRHIKITPTGREAELKTLPPVSKEILEALRARPHGMTVNALRKEIKGTNIDHHLVRLTKEGLIETREKMTAGQRGEKKEAFISLNKEVQPIPTLSPEQERVINTLITCGELTKARLATLAGVNRGVIDRLRQKGLLVQEERPVSLGESLTYLLLEKAPGGNIELNEDQIEACSRIIDAVKTSRFSPFLLHGVTGSGKTEVYLEVMEYVLKLGGGVMYLVPEIALTPQLLGRLKARFPAEEIAVLHSGISEKAKHDQWRALRRGKIKIVCGARSAVFAPLQNVRLIIVDEEHDESYKQEERFPYNAKDLALMRGQMQNATVILGSATPAINSYYLAQKGRYTLLVLPSRVERRPLPQVEIVDLRLCGPGGEVISPPLKEAIKEELEEGKQVMLFLNRRGFHPFLLCRKCGYVLKCPNCDLSLTVHTLPERLNCHYCGFSQDMANFCPRCRGKHLAGYGVGTQKVQEAVGQLFPSARVVRLDRDTAEKPILRSNILKSIAERKIDIIVGTQMISKGHDFPHITLVGVICADISLNLPDFRAGEKTFQILTQVAGRGGRGDKRGRVIIQTFNPDHYVIKYVQDNNFSAFFEKEISHRAILKYPPFCRLMCLQVAGVDKDRSWQGAQALFRHLNPSQFPGSIELLGPVPAPISRLRGRYRWQIIVKGKDSQAIHAVGQLVQKYRLPSGLQLRCDIDPQDFM